MKVPMRGLTATAQRSVWSLPALAGIPRYGYLGLIVGFGVIALLLILFTRGRLGYQYYRPEDAS